MPRSKKIRSEAKNNACYFRAIKKNGKWRGKDKDKYVKHQTVKKKYENESVFSKISVKEEKKIYKSYKNNKKV